MWSSIRMSAFCAEFANDPNENASRADVLVVGAGFSISKHFHFFFAFLFNRILSHEDERQFTRRLQYVMDGLPQNAKRQSYMYVQEGNGIPFEYETVLKDMATVRSKLPQPAEEIETSYIAVEAALCLEGTLARVETERAYSSATITRFGNNMMEAASGAELMCAGAASDRVRTLQEDFRREDIAKGIIKKWEPDTAKYTKFIGNNSAIVSVVRKAKQLLCWLCYLYQNIRGGEFVTTEASIPTDP
ncbi:unnamed protein product [Cylindrotheca closterium]|nr:unnamed protein product [Cylindrotheca closterium]